ncbi:MAG: Hsp20/alpha crystallin family protein [Desulfovibrio sp.]|nr:Hsp20/alpha crystallin family protein [Desulfovibrio sp.]
MHTMLTPSRRFCHRGTVAPATSAHDDIDTLLGSFFNTMLTPWGPHFFQNCRQTEGYLMPRMDLTSDEKAYKIHIDVPGVDPDDVKLSIHDGALNISGEKKCESEDKHWHVTERSFGSFSRSITLPDDVDIEGIAASHKNGVLTVTIPRVVDAGNKEKIISISKE